MKANYAKSLAQVLKEEGGYINDPQDPGGATNFGVTHTVYDDYRVNHGLPTQSVRAISQAEVSDIYKSQYWNRIDGDSLPAGVDYATFDFAVNSGVSRASRFLQAAVGSAPDGVIGPVTVGKVGDPKLCIDNLCDKRQAFLQSLPTFNHFGKGWTARVSDVRAFAKGMVSQRVNA